MGRPLTKVLTPLGYHLRGALRRRGMSVAKFAQRIDVEVYIVMSTIYRGRRIDEGLAKRFEAVLGISATTWLRLQEEKTS